MTVRTARVNEILPFAPLPAPDEAPLWRTTGRDCAFWGEQSAAGAVGGDRLRLGREDGSDFGGVGVATVVEDAGEQVAEGVDLGDRVAAESG